MPEKLNEKERARIIFQTLESVYPGAKCSLNYKNPLQLLVATILSAQCTDERVNLVTASLFVKYPDALAFAKTPVSELEQDIRSTGFYRNKAKNIQAACLRIVNAYKGEVPANMDDLLTLAGVARKTANVVLGNAFNISSGFVVDTHIGRLAQRMGFSKQKLPEKIEQDLMTLFDQKIWVQMGHILISHGRKVCTSRKAHCELCPIEKLCPKII